MKSLFTVLAVSALTVAASAQSYIVTGALTASDPRFNRPTTLSSLSGVGTSVAYDVYKFKVSVSGTYGAEMLSPDPSTLDTYLLIYSSFNPASPLTGLLNGDDDYSGALSILGGTTPGTSAFRASKIAVGGGGNYAATGLVLTAGTTYTAVAPSPRSSAASRSR